MGTFVSGQKLRIIGFKEFFGFPCRFPFGVITPLNLIEAAGLISSDASLMINNFYRVLRINKIGFQLEVLHLNRLGGNTKALLKLGYMKNIVDCR